VIVKAPAGIGASEPALGAIHVRADCCHECHVFARATELFERLCALRRNGAVHFDQLFFGRLAGRTYSLLVSNNMQIESQYTTGIEI
jgi:hypothetical protein